MLWGHSGLVTRAFNVILDKRPNAAYVGELLELWILRSVGDKEDDLAHTISILAVDILRSWSLICLHGNPNDKARAML